MNKKLLIPLLLLTIATSMYSQKLSPTKEEKKVLIEHSNQIEQIASINCEDALAELEMKYRWPQKHNQVLKSLLKRRELRKLAHNYIDSIPRDRMVQKLFIDSLFQDSIDFILIPHNIQISEPSISIALRVSDILKFPEKKQKTLQKAALDFARRKRGFPKINLAKEEIGILKNNLSNKELEFVIDEKNKITYQMKARRVWDELEREGIAYELDSAKQVPLAQLFYKLEMRYQDMFIDDKDLMEKNLQDIYIHKPKIVRMYEALAEKKRIKKKKEKSVGPQFTW